MTTTYYQGLTQTALSSGSRGLKHPRQTA